MDPKRQPKRGEEPGPETVIFQSPEVIADMESTLTDAGNADRFAIEHASEMKYVAEWGWLRWNGSHWTFDLDGEATRRALRTAHRMHRDSWASSNDTPDKKLSAWAVRSQFKQRLDAMVDLAKVDSFIASRPEQFDQDRHLMAFPNVTVDLRDRTFKPPDKKDYITRCAGAWHDPDAEAPLWEQCLDDWTQGDKAHQGFLQRAAGYSMSGVVREHKMFVLYGEGRNGKTVFAEALMGCLGDYAGTLSIQSLLQSRHDRVPNDLAGLQGKRFVVSSEPGQNRYLDTSLVKLVTGGDTIPVRFFYKKWFDLKPTFKLWMLANHLPKVRGGDRAVWSRMLIVPFNAHYPSDDPKTIKDLTEQLMDERKGIVKWGVDGAFDYFERGSLAPPRDITTLVKSYEEEMDHVIKFMRDGFEVDPKGWEPWADVKEEYDEFCEEEDIPLSERLGARALGKRLDALGYPSESGKGHVKGRRGLRLKSTQTLEIEHPPVEDYR